MRIRIKVFNPYVDPSGTQVNFKAADKAYLQSVVNRMNYHLEHNQAPTDGVTIAGRNPHIADTRLRLSAVDIEFVNKLGEKAIPFTLVFTKADKESQKEVSEHVGQFKKELLKTWAELPTIFISSAVKRLARNEILAYIETLRAAYIPAEILKEKTEK